MTGLDGFTLNEAIGGVYLQLGINYFVWCDRLV